MALWQLLALLLLPLGVVALVAAWAEVRHLGWVRNLGLLFAAIAAGLLLSIIVMYSESVSVYAVALVAALVLWASAVYLRFARGRS